MSAKTFNVGIISVRGCLTAVLACSLPGVDADEKDDAQKVREQIMTNLARLGEAMHAYHKDHGALPPHAMYGTGTKPLLSWRVAILPYLNERELYGQFRLNEAWDSEHNKKLLEKMPAVYAPIGVKPKEKHTTFYQVCVGPGTPFEPGRPITFHEWAQLDGASNTPMILEAAEAVPWTKPADLPFGPDKPLPKLGSLPNEGGAYACAGDAGIFFIRRDIPEPLLRQFIDVREGGIEPSGDTVRKVKRTD